MPSLEYLVTHLCQRNLHRSGFLMMSSLITRSGAVTANRNAGARLTTPSEHPRNELGRVAMGTVELYLAPR